MALNPAAQRTAAAVHDLAFERTEQRYRTVRAFGLYLLIGACSWQFRLAVEALAGQTTSLYVNALISAFATLKVSLLISLTGFTTLWALAERRMRHRVIERLHARITQLEKEKDPGRSTSGLTPKGQTNPKDRHL